MIKVNQAKELITPVDKFFPCYLLGHAIRTDLAIGVADELWANFIRLNIDGTEMVWGSIDLAGMEEKVNEEVRKEISKRHGVAYENIIIGFVHTHSGPEFYEESPFSGRERAAVPGYMDYVVEQIHKAVDRCYQKDLHEVDVYVKHTEIDGYYGNRNGKDKIADKRLTTIEFVSGDEVVAGICSFACHPTVLGPQNFYVSADLAGYLARRLQKKWGVLPMTILGAAGDMSNRLYREGNDYVELKRTGDGIMKQVEDNTKREKIEVALESLGEYQYYREFELDTEAKKKQVAEIEKRITEAKAFDEKKVYTSALAGAKARVDKTHGSLDVQSYLMNLGDLFIVTMPAELFSCFGLQLKEAMEVKCPLLWGYSNYSVGYLADQEEYGSSFETAASEIPKGSTEKIVQELIEEITKMKK